MSSYVKTYAGSGARSSEVRVSYFDPETGEHLSEKSPKTRNSAKTRKKAYTPKKAQKPKELAKRGRPGSQIRVDGRIYPSITEAAKFIGCAPASIGEAFRNGRKVVKGHTVERVVIAKG